MIDAARHYAAAKDLKDTRAMLLQAADADPTDPRPLAELIVLVSGRSRISHRRDSWCRRGSSVAGIPSNSNWPWPTRRARPGDGVTVDEALQQVLNREPSFGETMAAGSIYSD